MISTNNLEPNVNKIEWDGEYNGEDGVLNIKSGTNGDNKEVRIEFDNNDLAKLLTMPIVNEPLTDRLKTAFLDEEEEEEEDLTMRDDFHKIVDMLSKDNQPQKSSLLLKDIPNIEMDILTPRRRHTKKYLVYRNKKQRTKHNKLPRRQPQQIYKNIKTKKKYPTE